jgi:hypothetical protein
MHVRRIRVKEDCTGLEVSMDALYEIGKNLGALETRVAALEDKKCGCTGNRRANTAKLPTKQKAIFAEIKSKHEDIVTGFNEVLKKLKLADRVKLDGFTLVDVGVNREDDEDMCCMCCSLDGQSGWQYCCDYTGCSSCC